MVAFDIQRTIRPERSRSTSVLVVENIPTIRELLYWTLNLQGFHSSLIPVHPTELEWIDTVGAPRAVSLVILKVSNVSLSEGETFLCRVHNRWNLVHGGGLPPLLVLTTTQEILEGLTTYPVLLMPFRPSELISLVQFLVENRRTGWNDFTITEDNNTSEEKGQWWRQQL